MKVWLKSSRKPKLSWTEDNHGVGASFAGTAEPKVLYICVINHVFLLLGSSPWNYKQAIVIWSCNHMKSYRGWYSIGITSQAVYPGSIEPLALRSWHCLLSTAHHYVERHQHLLKYALTQQYTIPALTGVRSRSQCQTHGRYSEAPTWGRCSY